MTRFSQRMLFLTAGLVSCFVLIIPIADGCGPDFPNSFLSNSVDELSSLPTLSFERELIRLLPAAPPKHLSADEEKKRLAEAEVAEIKAALSEAELASDKIEEITRTYKREQPPAELPGEFALYAKGAREWRAENYGNALAAWRELLALPEKERRYRTVWASYMIGRALWAKDPAAAREAFCATRGSVEKGFPDSQKLATASLGWEARTFFRADDYATAMKLYFQEFARGGSTALSSLQFTVQRVFQGTPEIIDTGGLASTGLIQDLKPYPVSKHKLKRIAADRELRQIVAAWFTARGGPRLHWSTKESAEHLTDWLDALRTVEGVNADEADRYCWAAYQAGLWDDANRFAERAHKDSPASEWVRAMLALRAGKSDLAAEHMANVARHFPKDEAICGIRYEATRWESNCGESEQQPLRADPLRHLGGVCGVLALNREKYADALRLFHGSGHASDAAYVAEYVLTVDELLNFVREEKPARLEVKNEQEFWRSFDLQYLLARRLVRVGRFDEAVEFFPAELLPAYNQYIGEVRAGHNTKLTLQMRAESFWSAAQLIMKMGMEIQGTELEPDYAIWSGYHAWPETWRLRAFSGRGAIFAGFGDNEDPKLKNGLFIPSSAELDRAQKAKVPSRRFHYRYRATELAWMAASLLPNDTDLTATVLNTAGNWIAARDPQSADLFYKTLVIRCPSTEIGRAAAAKRWLVPSSAPLNPPQE